MRRTNEFESTFIRNSISGYGPKQKEILREWANALLSGEYRQGKRVMVNKTDEGFEYCCLGVLCEIQSLPKDEEASDYGSHGFRFPNGNLLWTYPHSEWFGKLFPEMESWWFAELNDTHKWSFEDIGNLLLEGAGKE